MKRVFVLLALLTLALTLSGCSLFRTCAKDAKICPGGTAVGRHGPDCEFDPCPCNSDNPGGCVRSCVSDDGCKCTCSCGCISVDDDCELGKRSSLCSSELPECVCSGGVCVEGYDTYEKHKCENSGGKWGRFGACPDCEGCLCDFGCDCSLGSGEYMILEKGGCRECASDEDCLENTWGAGAQLAGSLGSATCEEGVCVEK